MNKIRFYNAVMILGSGVHESKRRAQYASELLQEGETPIILSGGVPIRIPIIQNPYGKSEAEIMEEVLLESRINEKRIYLEKDSQNTLENFVRSRELIKRLNARNIAVITGKMHMKRALQIARETMPDLYFDGFAPPLNSGNIVMGIVLESLSGIAELSTKENSRYRFYNNPHKS